MKRRWNTLLLFCSAMCFAVLALTACGQTPDKIQGAGQGRLSVVTTLFPYYDFTRQVAGGRVDLSMVVPAGMDSHSFEPTPADMKLIQEADVLICNGGEMEHWLSQVLDAVDTSGMTIVRGMDYVDTVQEEIVEGMEDEAHGHEEDMFGEDDGHGVEIEYDEHIWTSPVNAMALVDAIGEGLITADPAGEAVYHRNMSAYTEQLKELDARFREVAAGEKRDLLVVGDKFPFRYLAEEYGWKYRAAFSGCSTDTEPSARTIAYLIDKVRDEGIPVVYYLELSSHRVSEIIGEETGAEPLLLHSCHNVTRSEFDSGITYLSLMEQNVRNLRKGLDE